MLRLLNSNIELFNLHREFVLLLRVRACVKRRVHNGFFWWLLLWLLWLLLSL